MPKFEVYMILTLLAIVVGIMMWTWRNRHYLTDGKVTIIPAIKYLKNLNFRKYFIVLILAAIILFLAPLFFKIGVIILGLSTALFLVLKLI